jgi:peptide/nickel transport system substrate-binding protein
MSWLETGLIDLMIQASGAQIDAGLELMDKVDLGYAIYNRNGYGRIVFQCDWGPTQFEEVRRAIAWCLDREEFARLFIRGWGEVVHTRVGAAQWMFIENRELVNSAMTEYTLNTANATAELVAGGWTLDADGNDWNGSGPRHKLVDGVLMPLIVRWASPDSNEVGATLASLITEPANSIGLYFNQDFVDGNVFMAILSGVHEERFNMINGGVGFATLDSPWYNYRPLVEDFGTWNGSFLINDRINNYTQQMKQTSPGDKASYFASWFEFVKYYNHILPSLPLYADVYYDFFNSKLEGYERTALQAWMEVVIRSTVSE